MLVVGGGVARGRHRRRWRIRDAGGDCVGNVLAKVDIGQIGNGTGEMARRRGSWWVSGGA